MTDLKLIWIAIQKGFEDQVSNRIRHTMRLLCLAILVPAVSITLGMLSAGLGERVLDSAFLVTFGKLLIGVSVIYSGILLTLFWIIVSVSTEAVVVGSAIVSKFWKDCTSLEQEMATKAIRGLAGVVASIMLIGLVATLFPLWRNFSLTLVVVVGIFFLVYCDMAGWVRGRIIRDSIMAVTFCLVICSLLTLMWPAESAAVRDTIGGYVGRWAGDANGDARVREIEREYRQEHDQLVQREMRRVVERQNQLRAMGLMKCGRPFCSKADKIEYKANAEKYERLKSGTYWRTVRAAASKPASSGASAPAAVPVPGPSAVKVSGIPALPPPLPEHVSGTGSGSGTTGQLKPDWEDIFRELDKYPDL